MNFLSNLIRNISLVANQHIFGPNRISPLLVLNCDHVFRNDANHKSLIDEIMADGMLLAVPKKRRTVEKRLSRRFGVERYPDTCDMIRPRQDLVICDNCGHYHQMSTLCGHCYDKVRQETNKIFDAVRNHFKFSEPIEKEIDIRYKDEQRDTSDDRVVVEMDHQRPQWFAKNLLSKSVGDKWTERKPSVGNDELKVRES